MRLHALGRLFIPSRTSVARSAREDLTNHISTDAVLDLQESSNHITDGPDHGQVGRLGDAEPSKRK
jgi:hypothetical protein